MNENKNKIIIALTLIIFVSLFSFLIIIFSNNSNDNSNNGIEKNDNFEIVSDYIIFFTVEKNVNNYVANINENYIFEASKILKWHFNDNINAYYVKGNILEVLFEEYKLINEDKEYLVLIDSINSSVEISECDNYNMALDKMNNMDKKYYILQTTNNKFIGGSVINSNDICLIYLNDFIKKIYLYPQKNYSIINNINSKEELMDLLEKKNFSTVLQSCELAKNNNKKNYIISDINGNVLKFDEISIKNYSVTIVN